MIAPRIGIFFIAVGFGLIVLFVLTDLGNAPQFGYFFLGLVGIILGVALIWRAPTAPPAQSSGRFRMVKHIANRSKARKK